MPTITEEELIALQMILDKNSVLSPEEGDYAEMDEDNVVYVFRKDGTPVMYMPKEVWDELQSYKEDHP